MHNSIDIFDPRSISIHLKIIYLFTKSFGTDKYLLISDFDKYQLLTLLQITSKLFIYNDLVNNFVLKPKIFC